MANSDSAISTPCSSTIRKAVRWTTGKPGAPFIQLNASYTHVLTADGTAAGLKALYDLTIRDYNRPNFLPTFLVEAGYEFEQNSENYAPGIPRVLRLQEYWSNLSGTTGQLYGEQVDMAILTWLDRISSIRLVPCKWHMSPPYSNRGLVLSCSGSGPHSSDLWLWNLRIK